MSKDASAQENNQPLTHADRVIALLHSDAAGMAAIFSAPDSADILGYDLGEILKKADSAKTALILEYATTHGKPIQSTYLAEALPDADTKKTALMLRHPFGESISTNALATALARADEEKTIEILRHPNSTKIAGVDLVTALCDALRKNAPHKQAVIGQYAVIHKIDITPKSTWAALRNPEDIGAFLDLNQAASDADKMTTEDKISAIRYPVAYRRTFLMLASFTAEEQATHLDKIARQHPQTPIALIAGKAERLRQFVAAGHSYAQAEQQLAVIPKINDLIHTAKRPFAILPEVMMGSICHILAGGPSSAAHSAWANRLRISASAQAPTSASASSSGHSL